MDVWEREVVVHDTPVLGRPDVSEMSVATASRGGPIKDKVGLYPLTFKKIAKFILRFYFLHFNL